MHPAAPRALLPIAPISTAGNLLGGIGLVATTHAAQAVGAEEFGE